MLAALVDLGCQEVRQTERHIIVCRGAVKLATIPKPKATGRVQFEILGVLDFPDADRYYLSLRTAIARREDREHAERAARAHASPGGASDTKTPGPAVT